MKGNTCQGFLKIGTKKLFIWSESGSVEEMMPLCVLDFYVHESIQRLGLGRVRTLKLETVWHDASM